MTIPTADDQPTESSGPLLEHLARLLRLRTENLLTPLGLRPRHFVTLTLLRDGGGTTQQALAARLAMDGTNVVGLLNELESAGLVARRRSPEDRRRHIVELTDTGHATLTQAECAVVAAEEEVLGFLSSEERHLLYALLRKATSETEVRCTEAVL
ncbi:MarR family transcriptional regulator [Sphaerisporangium melleum]|uniref:MarR family transcriptional regulator n=1 Tax=Sphaerisporangium melleum TaxID=321316 RepID=A0A917RFW4_9ACTN|nr:MarR family winged helix-turn-helix transcriptional regulator [Sphaerisporangium melleum]GGL04594.1 MarR family transcriptional regulator [Sphaerisporangium melleum]GII74106.1 MarR family transcriptional regulator [Sphaerisporangium melleum]